MSTKNKNKKNKSKSTKNKSKQNLEKLAPAKVQISVTEENIIEAKDGAILVEEKTMVTATMLEAVATADTLADNFDDEDKPSNTDECIFWKSTDVTNRIRKALSIWSEEPEENILPNRTLGGLAKGTPWDNGAGGKAQQLALVEITNEQDVFSPFESTLDNPPQQPPSTTVAQWEEIVWENQNPETFCFHLVPNA